MESPEDASEEDKIVKGFDRGVDYLEMKTKLIEEVGLIIADIEKLSENKRGYEKDKLNLMRKYIYCLIAIIQLRNGARISEAVNAFEIFIQKKQKLDDKVNVKIAKSKATKYKKGGEKVKTKTRYRKMIFPLNWVNKINDIDNIRNYLKEYEGSLNKRVLDYLNRNYKCNTHSLRYAYINYMLYTEKKEMTIVAKFIGHSNINQLIRYTQCKESDKLFDIEM